MLFCMGKGREGTGALLGEGQDEDSPASGQHGSCSGGEGGGDRSFPHLGDIKYYSRYNDEDANKIIITIY